LSENWHSLILPFSDILSIEFFAPYHGFGIFCCQCMAAANLLAGQCRKEQATASQQQ